MTDLPQQTLVCLVTCSMDESRRDLAVRVVQNLADKIPDAGLSNDFILFDNASAFKDHIQYVPQGTKIIQSAENIGYWTAIKWVLENAPQVMGRSYKYIYMVESDLYHTDLKALAECEKFLDACPDASCVRTQEFSVRWRWRFDKGLQFLPFHVTRSEIRLLNLVTNEKAWFKKTSLPHIYKSNLHAKLPALNRVEALKAVFTKLEQQGDFSEGDFFAEMVKIYPHIGVYDGGLFYSIYSRENMKTVVSGSYSGDDQLKKIGYQTTRYSCIVPITQDPEVKVAS
ncbi:MAG: hypothetical protein AUJ12_07900 [Alphaproteobacteria bacterium CG1_02_46_17]|nr:MAG: hypothetical protein AUJ12_07900 [Alphaproteobacteria bacterium CG1_02_46_17]